MNPSGIFGARDHLVPRKAAAIRRLKATTPRVELRQMIDRYKQHRRDNPPVVSEERLAGKEGVYERGLETLRNDPSQWTREGEIPTRNPHTRAPQEYSTPPGTNGGAWVPNIISSSQGEVNTDPSSTETDMRDFSIFGLPSSNEVRGMAQSSLDGLEAQTDSYRDLSRQGRKEMRETAMGKGYEGYDPSKAAIQSAALRNNLSEMDSRERAVMKKLKLEAEDLIRRKEDARKKQEAGFQLSERDIDALNTPMPDMDALDRVPEGGPSMVGPALIGAGAAAAGYGLSKLFTKEAGETPPSAGPTRLSLMAPPDNPRLGGPPDKPLLGGPPDNPRLEGPPTRLALMGPKEAGSSTPLSIGGTTGGESPTRLALTPDQPSLFIGDEAMASKVNKLKGKGRVTSKSLNEVVDSLPKQIQKMYEDALKEAGKVSNKSKVEIIEWILKNLK